MTLKKYLRPILLLLPLFVFLYTFTIYILYKHQVHLTTYVPCYYPKEMEVGSTITVNCYMNTEIPNPGTYSFFLPLYTNPKNIQVSRITIIIPGMSFIEYNISDVLPSDHYQTLSINIPSWAEYVDVWAKMYCKPDQSGDYPDYPYIRGGNHDLEGTVDTRFLQGRIIDRPGNYTITIYSGRGGGGAEYIITVKYGGYPGVAIYLNDNQIFYQERVSSNFPLEPSPMYYKYGLNTIKVVAYKVGGFNITIQVTYPCSVDISEKPSCMSYYDIQENKTVYICYYNITSTCSLKDLGITAKLDLSKLDLPNFNKATEIKSVTVGGTPAKVSGTTVYITSLEMGSYVLTVAYAIPGKLPTTAYKYGACLLQTRKIIFVGKPGEKKTTTIYVANVGTDTITVSVKPSESIEKYVVVTPSSLDIQPNGIGTFTIEATIPSHTIEGKLILEGCEGAEIEVVLSTSAPLLDIVQFIIPLIGSISLWLLLIRRGVNKYIATLIAVAVFIFLLMSYRILIYGTLL